MTFLINITIILIIVIVILAFQMSSLEHNMVKNHNF